MPELWTIDPKRDKRILEISLKCGYKSGINRWFPQTERSMAVGLAIQCDYHKYFEEFIKQIEGMKLEK
ncbi:hypothetical protein L1887_32594 [Cichorium endivia]|nr:hypothetical protein L1887_32594 [Cichorium endivia]